VVTALCPVARLQQVHETRENPQDASVRSRKFPAGTQLAFAVVNSPEPDLDAVLGEIRSTVEAGIASGQYAESLEDELRSHFARILDRADRDRFGAVWSAVDDLEALRALPAAPKHTGSRLPGGEIVHKATGRLIDRQLADSNDRTDLMWQATLLALRSMAAILDEPVNHTHADLIHELDTLQDRVTELEHRLARAEPAPGRAEGATNAVDEA